jgi:transcriptional regulator with XRE-family HTH domain
MGIAARIRAFRVRTGKSQAEMAQQLTLNVAWYADLEARDAELVSTLTMFKAMELASIFGVSLHELLDAPPAAQRISLLDLPDRITAYAGQAGIPMAQLEDQLGGDLREFFAAPVHAAAELPIAFFQALAAVLGINWLALVPDES